MTATVDKRKKAEIEKELDEALEATFPASDPVAIGGEQRNWAAWALVNPGAGC